MDGVKWTEIATLSVAVVAALVAAVSPWIGWRLARKGQQEDARRQVKLNVFAGVMENRHSTDAVEAIRALNLIDVAFHDSPNVRRLWREYFEMINSAAFFQNELGAKLRDQKLQELLTTMALSLDFGVDQFDVARIYAPRWLVEDESLRHFDRQNRLEAVRRAGGTVPGTPPAQPMPSPDPNGKGLTPTVYLVRFSGQSDRPGVATLAIGNGTIAGSDVTGCRYEGTYSLQGERLRGAVVLSAPPGTTLVTGAVTEAPTELSISLDLPVEFAGGRAHQIDVAGHPVSVSFERIEGV